MVKKTSASKANETPVATAAAASSPTGSPPSRSVDAGVQSVRAGAPRSESDQLGAVVDLLMGRAPQAKDDGAQGDGTQDEDGAPTSGQVQQVVEAMGGAPVGEPQGEGGGGEADDQDEGEGEGEDEDEDEGEGGAPALYATRVRMKDGSELTVGELKDHYQARAAREVEFQERENKLAEQLVEQERAVKFFDSLPMQMKYRMAEQLNEQIEREARGLLEVFPGWRDERARQADTGLVEALAKEYGLAREIAAELRNPTDRRVVKMLVDYARLRQQVTSARERLRNVSEQKPQPRNAPRTTDGTRQRALEQRARQTRATSDQVAAVAELLR